MAKNPTVPVCDGGTADSDSTTVTFKNSDANPCTITGLGGLLKCGDKFQVPGKSSKTCDILPGAQHKKRYDYTVSGIICPMANPSIVYQ